MKEKDFNITEDIVRKLCDGMSDFYQQIADKRLSAAIFLYLTVSIAEDITFKQAYEKYEVRKEGELLKDPDPTRYIKKNFNGIPYYIIGHRGAQYIEYECGFRLVKREQTAEIPYHLWNDIMRVISEHLIKQLKIY